MELHEALEIFGFKDGEDIDSTELKKRYRKLALKNHPDHGGDTDKFKDINEANSMLLNRLKIFEQIKRFKESQKVHAAIISLKDYISLYNGNTFKLSDGYILKKGNVKSNRIFIEIPYSIDISGYVIKSSTIVLYRIDDKYEIYVDIPDVDITQERDVKIQMLNKQMQFKMIGYTMAINLNFYDLVRVRLVLTRTLCNEEFYSENKGDKLEN